MSNEYHAYRVFFCPIDYYVGKTFEANPTVNAALEIERELTRRYLNRSQARPKFSFKTIREMRPPCAW